MQKFVFVFLLSSIFLTNCTSIYMPNVPATPMLSSKGELHAAAHVSLKGNTSFSSAYAASEHLGIFLNGSLMNQDKRQKAVAHHLLETGIGYFTTFGAEKNRLLEVYAGTGWVSSERIFKNRNSEGISTEEIQQSHLKKNFLQLNYSSKNRKTLNLLGARFPLNYGTALRISHVRMKDFSINNVSQGLEDNIFLEPVFFTRMPISRAVQLQYISGSNFGLKNRKYLTAGNSVFSVGMIINVGGRNLRESD